jgi:DNA mismatch repair protein MutS2
VRDVLRVARGVAAHLRRDPHRLPLLADRADSLPDLRHLARALDTTLDDTGQVRDDASPALAAARAAVRELRTAMEARLMRLVRDPDMGNVVAEDYVTLRNGRFVVPVRTAAANVIPGVIQDRSASGETVFLEPLFAVELNNRLLLSAKDVEAEERRVRVELTDRVREHAAELVALEDALAGIDALAAAAELAAAHACTRPTLGAADVALLAARHPLLLAAGRQVVPVELRIPADRRGLCVTGPNAGGKTVALKTLGLCALMAQAGLFVPAAEGSRLPVFGAVLADIGDEQSIDRDLSTFTAHIENLAAVAAAAGTDTLVLLDEPGAGTDPVEGAALAVGLLEDLLARGPRVVFTSHFPQVKTFALSSPALDVAAFDVDPATGAPRFALAYHTVGQSLALPIARRYGLPARAIEAAERLLAGESRDLALAVARSRRAAAPTRPRASTRSASARRWPRRRPRPRPWSRICARASAGAGPRTWKPRAAFCARRRRGAGISWKSCAAAPSPPRCAASCARRARRWGSASVRSAPRRRRPVVRPSWATWSRWPAAASAASWSRSRATAPASSAAGSASRWRRTSSASSRARRHASGWRWRSSGRQPPRPRST